MSDPFFRTYQNLQFIHQGQQGERQQLKSCHRRGPKTVPAQTAEIIKCHVIFIEIAGGDGIFVVKKQFRAF